MNITVTLPHRFLARDVHVSVEKAGRRWAIVALDAVGNAYDVAFDGWMDRTRYTTRAAAVESLEGRGAWIGQRLFATPEREVL